MSRSRDTTPPPIDPQRGGFSLIEMLLVVVIIGVLVQIAIPNYQAVRAKARAAELLGLARVIETAAEDYYSDEERFTYPAEAGTGSIPPGLRPYLPDGFSFSGEDFTLDWENYTAGGTTIRGVGIVTDNDQLGNALLDLVGSNAWFTIGNKYVLLHQS